MKKYELIRDILKDFVIPIILGVCSIRVANAANQIAESANETARLQALIAKSAEGPTIELVHLPGSSDSDASISITILDGKYSNFNAETVSFASFDFSDFDAEGKWTTISIVIPMQYYDVGSGQQAIYGKIWEWRNYNTAEDEIFFDNCKKYYMETHHIEAGTVEENRFGISVITCLKCSYLNLLDEEESVYYMIGSTSLVSRINQEEGTEWFQKYEKMKGDSLFIYYNWIYENDVESVFSLIDQLEADFDDGIVSVE